MTLLSVQAYFHWPITITAFFNQEMRMLTSHRPLSTHGKGMGSVNVPWAPDVLGCWISIAYGHSLYPPILVLHSVVLSFLLACHACALREACCFVCQFISQKETSSTQASGESCHGDFGSRTFIDLNATHKVGLTSACEPIQVSSFLFHFS